VCTHVHECMCGFLGPIISFTTSLLQASQEPSQPQFLTKKEED
jgi:hypothetical protein